MTTLERWFPGAVALLVACATPAARADAGGATPLADHPTLVALAVALSCADAPPAAAPAPDGGPAAGSPVDLVATIRARTIRFDQVPKLEEVLPGGTRRAVWRAERLNLPAHPEAGVVYRDVEVRLTLSTDLEELTAMLRDAKRASRGIRMAEEAPPAAALPTAPAAPAPSPTAASAPFVPSVASPEATQGRGTPAPATPPPPPSASIPAAAAPTPAPTALPPATAPSAPLVPSVASPQATQGRATATQLATLPAPPPPPPPPADAPATPGR